MVFRVGLSMSKVLPGATALAPSCTGMAPDEWWANGWVWCTVL